VLERQIDYGAKLGHVVLSLARMELNNFYKNVTPVSDFYDQRGMLISVSVESRQIDILIINIMADRRSAFVYYNVVTTRCHVRR
jgi:hypothetical protein